MMELFGSIATVLLVAGVILNARLNRACFAFWLAGNIILVVMHAQVGLVSLVRCDFIFIALAIYGWYRWKKKGIG